MLRDRLAQAGVGALLAIAGVVLRMPVFVLVGVLRGSASALARVPDAHGPQG
jgi:hypothetical protein